MLAILLASLLTLPLYPLNPVEEDTLSVINIHFTAGINGPNSFGPVSPEISIKYETLIKHPIVLRASSEYKYGTVNSKFYPNGHLHGITFSLEVFYYRGTDNLTAYLGLGPLLGLNRILGPLLGLNRMTMYKSTRDSLQTNYNIIDVSVRPAIGYRISMGIRYKRTYSIELSLSQAEPKLVYTRQISPINFSELTSKVKVNDVRITFGYLIRLKGI